MLFVEPLAGAVEPMTSIKPVHYSRCKGSAYNHVGRDNTRARAASPHSQNSKSAQADEAKHDCKRSLSDPKTAWFVYSMFPDTIMAWHV